MASKRENKNLQAALWYAEQGWAVLPLHTPNRKGECSCGVVNCPSSGKHPRTLHGVKDATTDAARIKDWWRESPDANVGIATGSVSGILVLDIDPRNDGNRTLREMIKEHGKLPKTPKVETGSGGTHYYFECLEETKGSKLPGIDVKADGGLVVAPPSLHATGGTYSWQNWPTKYPLREIPNWALQRVKKSRNGATAPDGPIPEGERNETLFRIGSSLRRNGADYDTILAVLNDFNERRCIPPLSYDEVQRTAESTANRYMPEPMPRKELTDLGNVERLIHRHGDSIRYTEDLGWLIWDGKRWARDRTGEITRLAVDTVLQIPAELDGLDPSDEDDQKEIALVMRWAKSSQSANHISAMIRLAQASPVAATLGEHFDTDTWLFNTENGTIDLTTGTFRPHSRDDKITKMAPVIYDPDATCPVFETFISQIMGGSSDLVEFVQRLFGYALTGDTREGILPILWGQGSNGKTTLLNTIREVMGGDYSGAAPPNLLIQRQNESHPTELVDLRGRRLVIAAESGEGKQLAIELIKQLTGGDKIKGRYMRQDFIEFTATHKIVLMTNFKPAIRNVEYATWRRIKLIPFTQTFDDSTKDLTLPSRLRNESSGILNWLIAGCLAWQRDGLKDPPEVREATDSYKEDSDVLADFLAECCELDPTGMINSTALYNTYRDWHAKATGKTANSAMSQNLFSRRLEAHQGVSKKRSNRAKFWVGVRIKNANVDAIRKKKRKVNTMAAK